MLEQVNSAQPPEPLPAELDFVLVLFDAKIGLARVLVPAGAKVEHIPYYSARRKRYVIAVCINDWCVGMHCGARTHRVITFGDEDGAARLCAVRNEARRSC